MKTFLPKHKTAQSGVTLFIAVVIMSLLLFISFAVTNITLKGAIFATSGKDSQLAFYAADAGIECVLYWDTRTDPSKFDPSVSGSPISCGGVSLATNDAIAGTSTPTLIGGGGSNTTSTFGFPLNQGANSTSYCVIVSVTKNSDGSTYVKSRGYNTCTESNPRRIERGIEVTY